MKALRRLRFGWRALIRSNAKEDELDEELRTHIEMLTEDNIARGMDPKAARKAAMIEFGGVERVKEDCRASWGVRQLTSLYRDTRYALRQLAKSPGFTAVGIVSLAIGIGANTAIFSIVNGILLRSLPVDDPTALREVKWSGTAARISGFTGYAETDDGDSGNFGSGSFQTDPGERVTAESFPFPRYLALREAATDMADVFGYADIHQVTVQASGQAFVANGLMVTDNFFAGIGARPLLGRLLGKGNATEAERPSAVISYRLWEREYDLDTDALGNSITLNRQSYTVVGVLPPGFNGVENGSDVEFYVGPAALPHLLPEWSPTAPDRWWIRLMARLREGVSDQQLQSALDPIFADGIEAFMEEPAIEITDGRSGKGQARAYYRKPLMLMLGAVGMVALVACANLAGLCLSRSVARQRELALRAAIGASRWALARQALLENAALAATGGVIGVVFAIWMQRWIVALLPQPNSGLRYDFSLDHRVLGFALVVAALTAIATGLVPAWRASKVDPMKELRASATTDAPRLRLGKALVVAQIALSVALVAVGGLYIRTLAKLSRIDPGFADENLLLVQLDPGALGIQGDAAVALFDDLIERIAAIPGAQSVALSEYALLNGTMSGGGFFSLPGRPDPEDSEQPSAHRLIVDERFFGTMNIPLKQGRDFRRSDVEGALPVVIVNDAFAAQYFSGKGALGQTVKMGKTDWKIVGISANTQYTTLKLDTPPTIYFTFRQWPWRLSSGYISVRSSVDPLSIVEDVRKAIADANSALPLASIETQKSIRKRSVREERLFALLVGSLALLSLFLSCIGLFGIMAYNVKRRSAEIGIRMAVGAQAGVVARAIQREALTLGAIGVALGIPIALAAARLTKSQLYELSPNDPYVYAAGVLLLLFVAWLASCLPSRRAARQNPMIALRAE